MNIKQTSIHLQRLGQPFDILIIKGGVQKELYKNLEPTDVEGLLNEVNDTHQPESIIIQEKRRNGSSNVKHEKFPVSLSGAESPIQTQMDISQPSPYNVPADFKDYMIRDLEKKNTKLESLNEKLETENETLKKENFELEKENKYKDKEFEIKERASEVEQSSGLAGIMETVSTNPALANLAVTALGRLMGMDVPPVPALDGGEQQPATDQPGDTPQEKIAGHIRNWLITQDEDTATLFFKLTHHITRNVEMLPQVLEIFNNESNEA